MTMRALLDVPMRKDDDDLREDVVLSVLSVLFEGGRVPHDEVRVLQLHESWGEIIDFLATVGISVSWYAKDPISHMWNQLDRTLLRLVFCGYIQRSMPSGRGGLRWHLSPNDGTKALNATGMIHKIVAKHSEFICNAYSRAYEKVRNHLGPTPI